MTTYELRHTILGWEAKKVGGDSAMGLTFEQAVQKIRDWRGEGNVR